MVSQSSKGNTVMKADFESLKEVVETLKASNDAKHAETHGHLADLKRDVSAILELLTTDAAPTSSLLSRRRQVAHSTPATTAAAVSFADLKFQSSEVAEAKTSTSTRRSLSRGGSGSDSKSASEDGGKYHVNVELKSLNMDDDVDVDKHVADIYERALRVHAEAKRALDANDRDRARRAQKIAANKAKVLEKREVDSSMSFDADTHEALRNRSAIVVEKTSEAPPPVLDVASEDGEMDVLEGKATQTSRKATASATSTPVSNRSSRISAKGSVATPPITSLSTVCCIPNCNSGRFSAGRKPKVDLLPFPSGEDGDLWMRWISDVHETAGVDVEDLDKASSVVCSLHFPTGGGNDPKVPIPLYFPCNSKGRAPRVVIGPLPSQESPKSEGEEGEEGEASAEKKKPAKSKKKNASKSRTVEVVVELPTESDEEKEKEALAVEKPKTKSQRKREHSPEASVTQNEEAEEETKADDKPLKQKSPSKKKKKGKKAKSGRSKPSSEAMEGQKDAVKQAEDSEESASPEQAVAKDKKKKKGKGKPKSKSRDTSAADDDASVRIPEDSANVPDPAVIPADAAKEPEVNVPPAAIDLDMFKAIRTGGTKKAKKTFPSASINGPPAKKAKVKLDLCCVVGCPNNREATRNSHCNLRSFPEAQDVRMQWINAILPCQKDKCWLPSANDLVCTEHFAIDVGVTETNTIDISPKSIPSKFPWNQPEPVNGGSSEAAFGSAVATVEKPSRTATTAAEMGANTSPRARRTKRRRGESQEEPDGESVQKTAQVEQNGDRETEQQEDMSGVNEQAPNEAPKAKSATVTGIEQVGFSATNGRNNGLASDEQVETVEEQSTPRIKAMPKRFKEAALAKLKQTSASSAATTNGDESDAAIGPLPDGHALVESESASSGGIAALADSVEYPANALSALSSAYADAGNEGGNSTGLSGHAGTAAPLNQAADRASPDLFPDSDPNGGIHTGPGAANADDGPDYEGADGASTGFDFPADAFDDELAAQRGGEAIPGLGGLQDPAANLFSFRADPPEMPGLPPASFLDTSGGSNPGAAADPSGFAVPLLGDSDFLERDGLIGADAFVGQHATGEMINELND